MSDEKKIGQKLRSLRADICASDWSPDGVNVNQGWEFLSEAKIKATLSPLLVKNGLEWAVEYKDLQKLDAIGSMKQHYIVHCVVTVRDTEGEEYEKYSAYGEGADSGDKAISKAQTNAFKNVVANSFMLSSYDARSEGILESNASAKSQSFNPEMKREAKDILVASSAKPEDKPKEEPSTPAPDVKKTDIEAEVSNLAMFPADGIGTVQLGVMAKIMDRAKTADEATLVPYGGIEKIEIAYEATRKANNRAMATKFINTYKNI